MALLTKFGKFTAPANSGTQVITGVGFQPKVLIFYSHVRQTPGYDTKFEYVNGFATGPSDQVLSGVSVNSSGASSYYSQQGEVIRAGLSVSGSQQHVASLASMDSNGFTLTWNNPFASGIHPYEIRYLALGGDELINAKALNAGVGGTTGTNVYNNVGFQPNALIFAPSLPRAENPFFMGLGFVAPNSPQRLFTGHINAASTGANSRITLNAATGVQNGASTFYSRGMVVAWSALGFSINYTYSVLADTNLHTLALEFANEPIVGTITQPTTASSQSVTGFGATPKAVWFLSRQMPASTTNEANFRLMQSVTDGTDSYGFSAVRLAGTGANATVSETYDLEMGQATTDYAQANVTLDADGFTTNWTLADTTPREVMYIAFVETPTVPPIDAEFDLSLTSTATINASAVMTAGVDLSADLDIAAAASVVRQSDYDFAALSAIDLSAARTVSSDVLATLQSDFAVTAARNRDASYSLLSDADLGLAHTVLKDASVVIVADLDLYYSTFQTQRGEFVFAIDSNVAYAGNRHATTAILIEADLAAEIAATRVLDAAWNAEAVSTIAVNTTRVREGTITSEALSDLDYAAKLLVRGRYLIETDSGIFVSAGARLSGDMSAVIESDMTFRAKPRLVHTYEDAYGRIQSVLVRGQHVPIIRTAIRPLIKGIKS